MLWNWLKFWRLLSIVSKLLSMYSKLELDTPRVRVLFSKLKLLFCSISLHSSCSKSISIHVFDTFYILLFYFKSSSYSVVKDPRTLHTKLQKMQLSSIHTTTFFTTAMFFPQFFIWATIFSPTFLESLCSFVCSVCRALRLVVPQGLVTLQNFYRHSDGLICVILWAPDISCCCT